MDKLQLPPGIHRGTVWLAQCSACDRMRGIVAEGEALPQICPSCGRPWVWPGAQVLGRVLTKARLPVWESGKEWIHKAVLGQRLEQQARNKLAQELREQRRLYQWQQPKKPPAPRPPRPPRTGPPRKPREALCELLALMQSGDWVPVAQIADKMSVQIQSAARSVSKLRARGYVVECQRQPDRGWASYRLAAQNGQQSPQAAPGAAAEAPGDPEKAEGQEKPKTALEGIV